MDAISQVTWTPSQVSVLLVCNNTSFLLALSEPYYLSSQLQVILLKNGCVIWNSSPHRNFMLKITIKKPLHEKLEVENCKFGHLYTDLKEMKTKSQSVSLNIILQKTSQSRQACYKESTTSCQFKADAVFPFCFSNFNQQTTVLPIIVKLV